MKTKTANPETKLSILLRYMAEKNWTAALRMAKDFYELGEYKEEITRAWSALKNPRFYEEIGQDPKTLIDAGISALKSRYLA